MRKAFLLLTLLLLSRQGFTQAYDGTVSYQKNKQPSAVIELPYPPSVVEDALKDLMKRRGYTGKESKGFISFKDVKDTGSGKVMDFVFKVERKSRKEKDESVVYLFGQGTNVDMTQTGFRSDMEMLKDRLNGMQPEIEAYNLEVQIVEQESMVKKAEKKYENLQDDQKSLEKKLKKLQDDLNENKKDQEKQLTEIENQKKILETLKAKRKG
jgi:hypothetical protein